MYPRLSKRIQAVLIDSIILPVLFFLLLWIADLIALGDSKMRTAIILTILVNLEPLMLTFTGSSLGQHLLGLKVRHTEDDRPISLVTAYLRTFIKLIFGLPSLIFISTTRRHQALHDLICKTLVVFKDPASRPAHEVQDERTESPEYIYPGLLRRTLVSTGYLLLALFMTSYATVLVSSDACLQSGYCTNEEKMLGMGISIAFLISLFVLPALGWSGRLYGCRRKKAEESAVSQE